MFFDDLKKIMGNNIKRLREENSIDIESFCLYMNLSISELYLIEIGEKELDFATLYKLSKFLNISFKDLFIEDTEIFYKSLRETYVDRLNKNIVYLDCRKINLLIVISEELKNLNDTKIT